jgi:hypothetical protein
MLSLAITRVIQATALAQSLKPATRVLFLSARRPFHAPRQKRRWSTELKILLQSRRSKSFSIVLTSSQRKASPKSEIAFPFATKFGRTALDEVNRRYVDSGFASSRTFIPAQVVQRGTLTMRIVECYIGDIRSMIDAARHALLRCG